MEFGSSLNFDKVIAYMIPGVVGLQSISYYSQKVNLWINSYLYNENNLGTIFIIIMSSIGIGLIISAIRWFILDYIHYKTGIKKEKIPYNKLNNKNITVFKEAIANTYRYYEFYGNMFIALLSLLVSRCFYYTPFLININKINFIIIALLFFLFFASRDSLKRTYPTINSILNNDGGK